MTKHADRRRGDPVGPQYGIGAVEQIAERAPVMRVHPTPAPMLRTIVKYVAALAESRELVERAVAGIMVEVRAGQHHRRPSAVRQDVLRRL